MILSGIIQKYLKVCKSASEKQKCNEIISAVENVGDVEGIGPKQWKEIVQAWTKGGWHIKRHGRLAKDLQFFTTERRAEYMAPRISNGWSHRVAALQLNRLKNAIRWAVSEELCSRTVWENVSIISSDDIDGVTYDKIKPADWEDVVAVKPYTNARVWDIIHILWLTGMRTGEVLKMKSTDIECSRDVWIYRPVDHKTRRFGKEKFVAIGPQAIEILRKYWRDGYLFTWRDSYFGEKLFLSYVNLAISRAKCKHWHPHQLRHSRATMLNNQIGLEAAASVLGNTIQAAQIYAEKNQQLAIQAARAYG